MSVSSETGVSETGAPPASDRALPPMTPVQLRTFNDLLAIGGDRPVAPPGLADALAQRVAAGTADALAQWTDRSLFLTKSMVATVLRCEGQTVAEADLPRRSGPHPATVAGQVAHRAIQIAHTHPGHSVDEYVRVALDGVRGADNTTAEWWDGADLGVQSDLITAATNRVTGFLDAWPPLHPSWTPRFELPVQAKVGRLTLSARADLVLGRPRPDGKQTMLIVDLKSGALREDEHAAEAAFYALVSTLCHGIPPFRSTVFSLASGTYTPPDVDAAVLHAAADRVVDAVNRYVAVLTERRPPVLTAGTHCTWCPARASCPAFAALQAGTPPATPPA